MILSTFLGKLPTSAYFSSYSYKLARHTDICTSTLVITFLRYFDFFVGWQGIVLQSPTGDSQKQVARHGETILNSVDTNSVVTNIISAAKPSCKLTRFYAFSDGQITSGNWRRKWNTHGIVRGEEQGKGPEEKGCGRVVTSKFFSEKNSPYWFLKNILAHSTNAIPFLYSSNLFAR